MDSNKGWSKIQKEGERYFTELADDSLDDLLSLAVDLCEAPFAIVSLRAAEGHLAQVYPGMSGTGEISGAILSLFSACSQDGFAMIPDLRSSARPELQEVSEKLEILFFAGVSFQTSFGAEGILAVFDRSPNALDPKDVNTLKKLARQASERIELLELRKDLAHSSDSFLGQAHFFDKLNTIEKEFIESHLVTGIDEKELYRKYLLQLESLIPGMKGSILRIEDNRLKNFVSPSLPSGLISTIENVAIGPESGSCGAAAYYGQRILASDVLQDPHWVHYRELARVFGVGACFSFPILDADGRVVGTVANYYPDPTPVKEKELQVLERTQRLITLLMSQYDYQERLRRNNERYELVNKSTNEAIFDWDVKLDKFYWGESLTRVFGHRYTADEFTLETWTSLMHPVDEQHMAEAWGRFMSDGKAQRWQNQFRFRKADGTYAHVDESAYVIRNEEGEPIRMVGVLRDRTELKQMESLMDIASKFSRVGGWELDLTKGQVRWSAMTREIHGVAEDFVPDLQSALHHYREDFRQMVNEVVNLAMTKGQKFDYEAPIITAEGEERWIRSIGEAEFLDGQCVRIFGSVQDIQRMKEMEDRIKGVSDSIPGMIFQYILKPDGTDEFRHVSKGSIPLVGHTPEEFMADSSLLWADVARGGDLHLVKQSIAQSAETLNPWMCEWRVLGGDGKIHWREGVGNPYRRADGAVIWDALIVDTTERKEAEQSLKNLNAILERRTDELALSNTSLEQFAYVASHDLQEPLRMVSSFLSLLQRKYEGQLDDKAQQYIHFAVDGAMRMKQIILDLLEYSRVGKEEKVFQPVQLEQLLFDVSQLQAQVISEKQASIRFEGCGTILGLSGPVFQVLQNLIGNALKYNRAGIPPEVTVSCKEETDHWLIAVQDNGIGIKEEYFEKVFVIFQRLHSREEYTGTGLGLAIVKKIVEGLGGKIWLDSVWGEGTTFYFTIPKPTTEVDTAPIDR